MSNNSGGPLNKEPQNGSEPSGEELQDPVHPTSGMKMKVRISPKHCMNA